MPSINDDILPIVCPPAIPESHWHEVIGLVCRVREVDHVGGDVGKIMFQEYPHMGLPTIDRVLAIVRLISAQEAYIESLLRSGQAFLN